MARPDKAADVAELTENFKSSAGAVLTEYRGLTVAQLRQLRTALGDDVNYAVVKNTLTKIAAKDAGVESFDSLLEGPSAIAFIKGDPVVGPRACVTSPRRTPCSSSRPECWKARHSAPTRSTNSLTWSRVRFSSRSSQVR